MIYLAIAAFVLLAIDWRQTITIAKNPDKWHETNPILGLHPSSKRVNVYFVICFALVALGVYVLPELWVTVGLTVLIVVEVWAVVNNFRLGIGI